MISYRPAPDSSVVLCHPNDNAFSDEAKTITQMIENGFKRLVKPRLELLAPDILQIVDESREDAAPVDSETADAAIQFASLLPLSLPIPEVAPDPNGEILFDWIGPSGKMFTVSVNRAGRIAYAGRFGERSKVHGVEELSTACPPEILRGIAKATS